MPHELTPGSRRPARLAVDIGVFEPETRCTTREVSSHAIWLEDLPALNPGEMVWLHLHLPDGRVLEATATVRRPTLANEGPSLHFSMFLRGGHLAWDGFLRTLAPSPSMADRREWPRVEGTCFLVRAGEQEWQSTNHSLGGLFVPSKVLLPVGEEVSIELIHPDTRRSLLVKAAVARQQPGAAHEPKGMGLRFLDLDERARAALAAFLGGEAQAEGTDLLDGPVLVDGDEA